MELVAGVSQNLSSITEKSSGPVVENKFTLELNDFDEKDKIQFKFQLLLDGPELAKEQAHGSAVFPNKSTDDILGFVSIKVKGNPEDAISSLKAILEGFGLSEEMIAQFAHLEFKAYENEVLIGFTPASEELLGFITPFLFNPVFLKGDGTQDLYLELSSSLNHTFAEALDDEPLFTHFLKGLKFDAKGRNSLSTANIQKHIQDNFDFWGPIFQKLPLLSTLLLGVRANGLLEFDCDEELREQIKEFVQENFPPACMALKDLLSFAKQSGIVPFEMLQPAIEWFANNFNGEIRVYFQRSVGARYVFKLPGLDQVMQEFLDA